MTDKKTKHDALFAQRVKDKGRYAFGNGLYLQVTATGSKSWLFRYMMNGKPHEMGLGAYVPPSKNEIKLDRELPLTEARAKALEWKRLLTQGIDPLRIKAEQEQKRNLEDAKAMTFQQCAEKYIEAHKDSWRNAKHKQQWVNTLKTYAYPVIGKLPVQSIDVTLVLKIIEPIWPKKTETASRLRGRIEAVLDWASAREYRTGENPARWRGKLESLLPHRNKQQRTKHFASLSYQRINEFLTALDAEVGDAAEASKILIYTATRTSEVTKARWDEFDLKAGAWTIPANRIKGEKEQRIPLSEPALAILKERHTQRSSDFVFNGRKVGRHMSDNAMLMLRRRMGYADKEANNHITIHGFRSTFRVWAAEQTAFPREVVEACLAHSNKDKVEAAYQRSDFFEKRRQLMEAWAKYCETVQPKEPAESKVVNFRR